MSKTIFDQFLFEIQSEMTVGELLELYKEQIHASLEKEVFADVIQTLMTEKKEELYREFRQRILSELPDRNQYYPLKMDPNAVIGKDPVPVISHKEMYHELGKDIAKRLEDLPIDPNLEFQKEVK